MRHNLLRFWLGLLCLLVFFQGASQSTPSIYAQEGDTTVIEEPIDNGSEVTDESETEPAMEPYVSEGTPSYDHTDVQDIMTEQNPNAPPEQTEPRDISAFITASITTDKEIYTSQETVVASINYSFTAVHEGDYLLATVPSHMITASSISNYEQHFSSVEDLGNGTYKLTFGPVMGDGSGTLLIHMTLSTEQDVSGSISFASASKSITVATDNQEASRIFCPTTSIQVIKEWIGPAASSATFSIYRTYSYGSMVFMETLPYTLILNNDNGWSGSFDNLPIYAPNGSEYTYHVSESNTAGYTSRMEETPTGLLFINTSTETLSIPVTKVWKGPAAASATINLIADETVIDSIDLSESNNWQYVFENLPKYDEKDGHEIIYDLEEAEIEGYHSRKEGDLLNGTIFTNTISGNIDIPVTKKWIGPAVGPVYVELIRNDHPTGLKLELSEENGWSDSFTDLEQYDDQGNPIQYSIKEDPVTGYKSETDGSQETGFLLINRNTETIDIHVEKEWIGPAADNVLIRLTADGKEIQTITLDQKNKWKHTFTDLPKYDETDGHEIVYELIEDELKGYQSKSSGTIQEGVVFTNTNTKTIDIPVTKKWVGDILVDYVDIWLLADGKKADMISLSDDNNWNYTFTELPKYDETDGHEINYTIQEVKVDGYVTGISGTAETGFVITNTVIGKVSVPVTKKWIGSPTDGVMIRLYANDKEIDSVQLNKDNDWQYTFTGLDAYDQKNPIKYTIKEDAIEGYTSSISGNAEDGYVVTNTKTSKTVKDPEVKPPTKKKGATTAANTGQVASAILLIMLVALLVFIVVIISKKHRK